MESIKRAARSDSGRELLCVAGGALLLTLVLVPRTDLLTYRNTSFLKPWDHHKYIYMAVHNPFDFHIAPYCWRVLSPLIAKAMPFTLEQNFFIISFISVWGTGMIVYYLARRYAFSRTYAAIGMVAFFSVGVAAHALLADFWGTDALAMFLVALAIYCAARRLDVVFLVLVAIGVACRESALLAVPLYYGLHARKLVDMALAKRVAILALPAVAVFIALHVFIPSKNYDPTYLRTLPYQVRIVQSGNTTFDLPYLRTLFIHNLKSLSVWKTEARSFIGALGVLLVVLCALGAWRNPRWFGRIAPFLALGSMQLMFYSTERYLAVVVPVMILLALYGIKSLVDSLDVPPVYWAVPPVLFYAFDLIWIDGPKIAVQVAALAVCAIGIILATTMRTVLRSEPADGTAS